MFKQIVFVTSFNGFFFLCTGGVFVVLLCGLALAVIVAFLEFCWNSKKNARMDQVRYFVLIIIIIMITMRFLKLVLLFFQTAIFMFWNGWRIAICHALPRFKTKTSLEKKLCQMFSINHIRACTFRYASHKRGKFFFLL